MHDSEYIKINIKIQLENKILRMISTEAYLGCKMQCEVNRAKCAAKIEALKEVIKELNKC